MERGKCVEKRSLVNITISSSALKSQYLKPCYNACFCSQMHPTEFRDQKNHNKISPFLITLLVPVFCFIVTKLFHGLQATDTTEN